MAAVGWEETDSTWAFQLLPAPLVRDSNICLWRDLFSCKSIYILKKKMEEKSTFCSQPFSIPLPAHGEVWIFNSDDLNCIINCCSIPRSNWAAGLIYSQGGWAAEPVVPLHESIKITGSESGVRKATAHFRVSTQTWRGYIQEKILLLPLMTAAFLNL